LGEALGNKKINKVLHVYRRRRELANNFDVAREMETIEETCVPSYLHNNLLAASVAWWRLFASESLYSKHALPGGVLDFGAASGELAHLLPLGTTYDFVEADENMVHFLQRDHPESARRSLESLPPKHYAAVFALDSLEHNDDVARIVDLLVEALRSDGVMIISGPTENVLYRIGRRIAGFSGHYHKTTIYDIERIVAKRLSLERRRILPLGVPLFSISCWRKKA
jgi:2-polyprenyl-3-methyl-5-hydroxy-6-metoxy-1,4-benzoquinol methylase